MAEALSEQQFDAAADEGLRALTASLDALGEAFEADLSNGILTIEFDDGVKFVVNSHRAARQIWMAADRSAWHFDFHPDDGRWVTPRGDEELWATLEQVVSRKIGRPVRLERRAGRS